MAKRENSNPWLDLGNARSGSLNSTAWHLLRVLANIADSRGFTSAKVADLAFACACNVRTVQYSLKLLKQRRMLVATSLVKRLDGSTPGNPGLSAITG